MKSWKFKSLLLFLLICIAGLSNSFAQSQNDQIAENMLVYQRSYGGWPKAVNGKKVVYEQTLNEEQKRQIKLSENLEDATIDNKATSREIRYLVKAYKQTQNARYLQAAQKGVEYLLAAQYKNGGWPQYYPAKKLYRGQITYNDDAIVNVLTRFYDIQSFEPIFIGRDAIIRKSLAEIDNERRIGYAWYGTWPQKLKDKDFVNWKKINKL